MRNTGVLFVGPIGHDFNPTNAPTWFTDLGFVGILARTSSELSEELNQWKGQLAAVVVRDRATDILAHHVLDELASIPLAIPCLVHAVSTKDHEGLAWAELVSERYQFGQFVQRGPENWPRRELEAFLQNISKD